MFTELFRKTRRLEKLNRELEQRVAERTTQLDRRRALNRVSSGGAWRWPQAIWDLGLGRGSRRLHVGPRSMPHLRGGSRRLQSHSERIKFCSSPSWGGSRGLEGAVQAPAYETEFRIRRPNGELRWCLGTAPPPRCTRRDLRIGGVTMDITERKHAEERQAFWRGS